MHGLVVVPVDDPPIFRWLRRLLLLMATWLIAHILRLLCDIASAVDMAPDSAEPEAMTSLSSPQARNGSTAVAGSADEPLPQAVRPLLRAGFSCPYVKPGLAADAVHAWTDLNADNFRVRCGPDYPKNGLKAPSAPALGTVVAVDCLRSDRKIFNFLSLNHIELPDPSPNWGEAYPEFVVINQMVPVHFNASFFTSEQTDGETLHVIVYIRLKPHLAAGYQTDEEPQNAEQLLKR